MQVFYLIERQASILYIRTLCKYYIYQNIRQVFYLLERYASILFIRTLGKYFIYQNVRQVFYLLEHQASILFIRTLCKYFIYQNIRQVFWALLCPILGTCCDPNPVARKSFALRDDASSQKTVSDSCQIEGNMIVGTVFPLIVNPAEVRNALYSEGKLSLRSHSFQF